MKLNELAELMFKLIPLMDHQFVRPVDIQFRSIVTPIQVNILVDLQRNDMTMKELSKNMMISKQQMTILIKNLVKNHYVTRKTSQKDRRVIVIAITKDGVDMLNTIKTFASNILKNQITAMNEDDQEVLTNAVSQLHSVISKYI